MRHAEPEYSDYVVNMAGDALIGDPDAHLRLRAESFDPLSIVNNWKAAHQYPQITFRSTLLKRTMAIDPSHGIAVGRGKRLSSIKSKLERYNWLKLSEMQDIAGCRAIVSSVGQVYELVSLYKHSYANHEIDDESDYIGNPKSDGYRSYHLIYCYANKNHREYQGLKVEIQFRSTLQHCWATAIETVGVFYQQDLKWHEGSPDWLRFFALMGEAIAILEGSKHVPRTPRDRDGLVRELRHYAAVLDVNSQLTAFQTALNVVGEAGLPTGIKHVLLVLDPSKEHQLRLSGFRTSDIQEALAQLEKMEGFPNEGADTVLVSLSNAANLRRAFPNYYLDTTTFLETMNSFIS